MKHRTHDHLFAAAGVTAALSLIGTGVTVLQGSVFNFDHWPLVAGDQSRSLVLPTAPLSEQAQATAQDRHSTGGHAIFDDAGRPVLLPGLGGGPVGIRSASTTVGAGGPGATPIGAGTGTGGSGPPASRAPGASTPGGGITLAGGTASLGSSTSSSIDGTRDPVTTDPGSPASTPRVAPTGVDTDGDGVPDTWVSTKGTPSAPTGDAGTTDGTTTSTAFRADPPSSDPSPPATVVPPTTDTPPVTATPPVDAPPTTGEPPPTTEPVASNPTPPSDPAPVAPKPADPAPAPVAPAPADAAPPADPAPIASPAPADPAPPAATPAPADPAPPAATPAPAEPAPSGTSAPAAAPDGTPANAAIPSAAR
jgi:hypothetical protein